MKRLSIVVNFYNEFAFITDALSSIFSQGIPDIEVIVVNDNQDEFIKAALDEIAVNLPVNVIHNEVNLGLAAARNVGIKAASGEYVSFLDADDFYLPNGLARMLLKIEQKRTELVHGLFQLGTFESGLSARGRLKVGVHSSLLPTDEDVVTSLKECAGLQSIVVPWKFLHRRDYLVEHGIQNEPELRKFEDRPFVLANLVPGGRVSFVNEPVRVWRKRPGSITSTQKSFSEIDLMLRSIEYCFDTLIRATDEEPYLGKLVHREQAHTLFRISCATPILAHALSEGQRAAALRSRISKLFSRSDFDDIDFSDEYISERLEALSAQGKKIGFSRKQVVALWQHLCEGEWDLIAKDNAVQNLHTLTKGKGALTKPA